MPSHIGISCSSDLYWLMLPTRSAVNSRTRRLSASPLSAVIWSNSSIFWLATRSFASCSNSMLRRSSSIDTLLSFDYSENGSGGQGSNNNPRMEIIDVVECKDEEPTELAQKQTKPIPTLIISGVDSRLEPDAIGCSCKSLNVKLNEGLYRLS